MAMFTINKKSRTEYYLSVTAGAKTGPKNLVTGIASKFSGSIGSVMDL